jgi:UDP-N-acetylglucosamine/UDP-N-acetylgalactosamine diphosphorylase
MDASFLEKQRECLQRKLVPKPVVEPWTDGIYEVSSREVALGEELISAGRVGCVILAGGQGSRLGKGGPKGAIPVSVLQEKSLFQLLLERVLYAGIKYKKALHVAIMVSSYNRKETELFLERHAFFGLQAEQVHIFQQEDLPFFDEEGNVLAKQGPSGNGRSLHLFYQSKAGEKFQQIGIDYLQVVPVDNALADPFDAAFIGFLASRKLDACLKAIRWGKETENMGVLASENGALRVIEYSEKGEGTFFFANTGLFAFSMDFIRRLATEKKGLPLHAAFKKVDGVFVWKFEYFLFDVLLFTKKIAVLVRPRLSCFSPLKNGEGKDSFATVKQDLLQRDKERYKEITGGKEREGKIELCPSCYYLPVEKAVFLLEKKLPFGTYIEPSL